MGEGGEKQKWWDVNLMRKENEKGDEKETWSVKKKKVIEMQRVRS